MATDPDTIAKVKEDAAVMRDVVRGKAMDRFRPLLERLMGKAVFENNPEIPTYGHAGEAIAAE